MGPNDKVNRRVATGAREKEDAYAGVPLNAMSGHSAAEPRLQPAYPPVGHGGAIPQRCDT